MIRIRKRNINFTLPNLPCPFWISFIDKVFSRVRKPEAQRNLTWKPLMLILALCIQENGLAISEMFGLPTLRTIIWFK